MPNGADGCDPSANGIHLPPIPSPAQSTSKNAGFGARQSYADPESAVSCPKCFVARDKLDP